MQRLSNDVGPGSAFKDRQCLDFCRDANRSEGCGPHGAEKSDESTDRKDERERLHAWCTEWEGAEEDVSPRCGLGLVSEMTSNDGIIFDVAK